MYQKVVIAGVGMVPFRKPGQSQPYDVMGAQAAQAAAPGFFTKIQDKALGRTQ